LKFKILKISEKVYQITECAQTFGFVEATRSSKMAMG